MNVRNGMLATAVSVVIATKDRAPFLGRALESLAQQRGAPSFDVVVADNGSTDGTAALVAERRVAAPFPLTGVYVPEPNRGAARNAGVAASRGRIVAFVDDDVWVPPGFVAAHVDAHVGLEPAVVSGPILNVSDDGARPRPTAANYSRAFLCTCNASVPRGSFDAVGGFDRRFDRYGWEDTELGLRLRARGLERVFAWDAYLYHIKPPQIETLDAVLHKTVERAEMAAHLLALHPGWRARLATGAYAANVVRSRLTAPAWTHPLYERLARDARTPKPVRAFARAQMLDAAYVRTLRAALADARDGRAAGT